MIDMKSPQDHGNSFVWFSGQKSHHNSSKMADEYLATRKTAYRSLSLVYRQALPTRPHIHLEHRYRRIRSSLHCVQRASTRRPVARTNRNRKKQIKMRTPSGHGETRCMIFQNGRKNSRRILWTKESLNTGTHLRALLMNQLQSR